MEKLQHLTGPEFLDSVADAESANCNDINAQVYRANSAQWAAERRRTRDLEQQVRDLTDRLDDIRRTAQAAG
mgnify:FL=1